MQAVPMDTRGDLYLLFEVHAYANARYPEFLDQLGELDKLTQSTKELLEYTKAEITRLDQWGRYNLYIHNPDLFSKHRVNMKFE